VLDQVTAVCDRYVAETFLGNLIKGDEQREDCSHIDLLFFGTAGVVDVSQMIKQFYATSGHS
jgi:hypothetical protein